MAVPHPASHAHVSRSSLHKGQFIFPAHRRKMPFNNAYTLFALPVAEVHCSAQLWHSLGSGLHHFMVQFH